MPSYSTPAHPLLFERVQVAMAAADVSLADLTVRLGGSKNAWFQRLRSKHLPTYLEDIAKACNVTVEWLRGDKVGEASADGLALPLIGQVTAGDGWANPSQDPDDSAPVIIKNRWRAVRIEGRSAEPIVLPGQCVLVDDTLAPKHGRLVCVQTQDGRAYCKRFCDVGDGHIVLAGLNAGQDSIALHREDIARISVVVGTVYTDSVAR